MKCFIILAIFLAISVHTIISQNAGETDNPGDQENGNAPDPNAVEETPTDQNGAEETPTDQNGGDETPTDQNGGDETPTDENAGDQDGSSQNPTNGDSDNTPETSDGQTPEGNDTAPETGNSDDNSTTIETNAMKVSNVIQGLPSKCSNRYTSCYGPDSTDDDIKNMMIATTSDDDVCELIEDGEDCVTSILETFVCTEEEYEQVREQACSGPQSAVVSVTLIGLLSLISKLLSQH